MDRKDNITACVAKITEIINRMLSGTPRRVVDILDDYDEFRRNVALLAEAGVLESEPYWQTHRKIRRFIAQFDTNIETIVTTRYSTARRKYDEATTMEAKRRVVREAAHELGRLAQYPEHQGHSLLIRVLTTLREWEARLEAAPREVR